MSDGDETRLIAIDWGTTAARAYRLGSGGRVLGERSAPLGIQQIRNGAFGPALVSLLGDWQSLDVARLACGMIGSRQGWVEASYHDCPVAVSVLASDLTYTPGREMAIVSGITCRDEAGVPDVMRGEETQIVGLVDDAQMSALVVQPGTHSKWTLIAPDAAGATIRGFATYMTGETFAVLREHSILGRLMRPAETFEREAFEQGARRGLAARSGGELLHQVFGARTLALFEELHGEAIADYLSGLLIGAEVAAGARWAGAHASRDHAVWLAGGEALCMRYAAVLRLADIDARMAPPDVAARGLWRLATHAGLVTNEAYIV